MHDAISTVIPGAHLEQAQTNAAAAGLPRLSEATMARIEASG
jgi:aryl-alcohol dehydrogenase-like predicted oxidoreductase